MITDILFTSPILHGDEAGISATGGAAGGQFSEYGGINPGNDPELAMALKISLEEEKAKQKAQEPKQADSNQAPAATPGQGQSSGMEVDQKEEEFDEEYYLQQAIKLSMMEDEANEAALKAKNQPVDQAQDLKEIATTDFMKDLIQDMNLDIDPSQMDEIMDAMNKPDESDKEKKDEEKKD